MNKSLKLSTAGLIAATLLSACGGGGGGTSTGGTAANTVSQGTITGFGSVIVDGVRYSSVGANVIDEDGASLSRDTLRIGMTVNVEGTSSDDLASGEARTIEVRRLLQGPVSNFQSTSGTSTFTVLGQNVETTASTLVVGSLANAVNVKVYGLLQQGTPDKIIASRIEEAVQQTRFEAYGRVSNLGSNTFNIGTLAVTSSVSLPTGLINGSLVKVSCSTVPTCSNGTSTLAADKIKLRGARNDLSGQNGAVVKLKGVVDAVNGNILTVAGVSVDISNAQREDDDANTNTSYTPVVGDRIEIKGSYNGTTLIARKIEQEGYRESKHEGTTESYSTELFGIVENAATSNCNGDYLVQSVCVDNGNIPVPSTGQYVEVKGNMIGDVLVAVKVEAKSGSQPTGGYIEIKGTISNFNGSAKTFTLDTLTVNYANATVEGILGNGHFVEVKGTQDSPSTFQANKVDVESNND